MALIDNLRKNHLSLSEFRELTCDVLHYLPAVISNSVLVRGYIIHSSEVAGNTKYVRPINESLFIPKVEDFMSSFDDFSQICQRIRRGERNFSQVEKNIILNVLYTIQQAVGAGFDLLSNPNSARKHVGNRFEELIRSVFSEIGVANSKTVLQIPYETDDGPKIYKCENDIILSGETEVRSNSSSISQNEIVVSVKTTSKDRMGKIFIDKMLLQNFTNQDLKVIGIFHNDVQRKESNNISYTLVSGLFLVYTGFLVPLEGIYYLDLPPNAHVAPFNQHLKPFSELLTNDLWNLLGS